MTDWSKDKIVQLLETNDKAVARALVRLNANQTADEQDQETVKYQNGKDSDHAMLVWDLPWQSSLRNVGI